MSAIEHNDGQWYVEDNPRWPYERFMQTYYLKPMRYSFCREAHNQTLAQLRKAIAWTVEKDPWLLATVDKIEQAGLQSLFELAERVSTQEQAMRFVEQNDIERKHLEGLLDFCRRRMIPHPAQLRQLFDNLDQHLLAYFEQLKAVKVTNSYTLLEQGRTQAGRAALAAQTRVPERVLLDFVHRADITRMAWVSGRMVKQLWAIGYTSLEQLRNADPEDYFQRMQAYYEQHGKGKPFDATPKTVQGLIDAAQRLVSIVEE